MYNGIGLQTARGSGTNGYVQRNLSHIKRKADRVDYTTEEQLKKLDSQFKQPNAEILLHEKKRQIEVKCLEMEELMEEQGYSEEEINKKLTLFRKLLTEKSEAAAPGIELDDNGRPIAKATHQLAEASNARNETLKKAFGISEYFKEGSSLDPDRKAKEKAAMEMAQAKYTLVEQPLSDDGEPDKTKDKKKKKKKDHKRKESDHSVEDEEGEEEEKPKKKKHKSSKDHKKQRH